MTDQPHLVLFDADHIAGFIFETGRLKEIRGGSYLVRRATQRTQVEHLATDCDPQARVIFAGGGSGLVRFSDGTLARAFIAELKRHYRQETISGSLSAVSVPYPPGGFAAAVEAANLALRRSKSASPSHDRQFVANPYTAICVSCGRRPAWRNYTTARGRVELLCAACRNRRTADDSLHQAAQVAHPGGHTGGEDRRITLSDLSQAGDVSTTAFLASPASQRWAGVPMPDELEDLGQVATPRNYLGFIHADGNRMGDHLHAFLLDLARRPLPDDEQEQQYGAFSEVITAATVEALAAALQTAFPAPTPHQDVVPFDVVLLAGDDLVLLTAAHRALDVAADFCDGFGQRMTARARELGYIATFTTAAGVVLANVNQPILYLQHQAEDLLHQAKHLCAQHAARNTPVSAVDFTVVTTSVLRSLKTIRGQDYTREEGDRRLRLTRRPYTVNDLHLLLAQGRLLKGLAPSAGATADPERSSYPRSQLHALYDAIFQSYDQALLQGARASLRVNAHQRTLLQEFAERFAIPLDRLPWATDDTTAFTDLVEVYDFLTA